MKITCCYDQLAKTTPVGPTSQPAWTVALAPLALAIYPTKAVATNTPAPRRSSSSSQAPAPATPSLVTLPVKVVATSTHWWLSGNGSNLSGSSSTATKMVISLWPRRSLSPQRILGLVPCISSLLTEAGLPMCPQKGLSPCQTLALAPPSPGSSSDAYKWRPQQALKKASAQICITSRSCPKALGTCRLHKESPTQDMPLRLR